MFANAESVEIFLCGIAAYLILAPVCIVTAGVCAWVLRQRELATLPTAGKSVAPPAPAVTGDHAPAVTASNESCVSTAA